MSTTVNGLLKIGDRVMMAHRSFGGCAEIGAQAIVTKDADSNDRFVSIKWDRITNRLAHEQMDGEYYRKDFELMKNEQQPNIVKPFGFTDGDLTFVRKMLIGAVSGGEYPLTEDEVAHAARLIHRLGRVGKK